MSSTTSCDLHRVHFLVGKMKMMAEPAEQTQQLTRVKDLEEGLPHFRTQYTLAIIVIILIPGNFSPSLSI